MVLCAKCCSIPPELITSADWPPYTGHEEIYFEHYASWTDLKNSASAGCPCCQALIFLIGIEKAPAIQIPIMLEKIHWESFNIRYEPSEVEGGGWRLPKTAYAGTISREWSVRLPLNRPRSEEDDRLYANCWLKDCLTNHKMCSTSSSDFVPTRLLDLGDLADAKDVRLVLTAKRSNIRSYFALSHCWGTTKTPVITTTENLARRMSNIPFSMLTTTFQDAVTFCRKVGVQYLWIDSLCILQNSREDWEKEAAVMGQVYQNALCTLAATCSSNGTEGCRVRHPHRYGSIDIDIGNQRVRLWTDSTWRWSQTLSGMNEGGDRQLPTPPLNSRAWTLQERELSTRILHFTEYMVLWECKEHRASTQTPWGQSKEERNEDYDFRLFDRNPRLDIDKQTGKASNHRSWLEIIDDYSTRRLTVLSDKLPALAGMAQQLDVNGGGYGRYVAGLWENDLPSSLLWKAVPIVDTYEPYTPCMRATTYRGPSWSWASLDGRVTHAQLVPQTTIQPSSELGWIIKRLSRDEIKASTKYLDSVLKADPLATLEEVTIDNGGKNPFFSVSNGFVVMSGKMKKATVDIIDPEHKEMDKYLDFNILRDGAGMGIGAISIDVEGEVRDKEDVFCLAIELDRQWPNQPRPWGLNDFIDNIPRLQGDEEYTWWKDNLGLGTMILGLALKRTSEEERSFRRVGLVRWIRNDWFSETKMERVKIV